MRFVGTSLHASAGCGDVCKAAMRASGRQIATGRPSECTVPLLRTALLRRPARATSAPRRRRSPCTLASDCCKEDARGLLEQRTCSSADERTVSRARKQCSGSRKPRCQEWWPWSRRSPLPRPTASASGLYDTNKHMTACEQSIAGPRAPLEHDDKLQQRKHTTEYVSRSVTTTKTTRRLTRLCLRGWPAGTRSRTQPESGP